MKIRDNPIIWRSPKSISILYNNDVVFLHPEDLALQLPRSEYRVLDRVPRQLTVQLAVQLALQLAVQLAVLASLLR